MLTLQRGNEKGCGPRLPGRLLTLAAENTESTGAWSWEARVGLTVDIQHGSTCQVLLWVRTLPLTHVSPSVAHALVAAARRGESRKGEGCLH